jgi:predicted NAD/FAD-binding protein
VDFLEYYLVPMSAAVWSSQPGGALDFPAAMLIRFFHNHGFLGVRTHHPWFTVSRGAKNYVGKILTQIADVCIGSGVESVAETEGAVKVRTADGTAEFDRVIIAAHADQALRMLERPDAEQERLLKAFRYQANRATLHTDASVMPRRRIAWASWNYRIEKDHAAPHYWMNALQNVSRKRDYFVSLNSAIRPEAVLYETEYDHPIFTIETQRAQMELASLNQRSPQQRVYFCGSYFRHGFHEDAYWSAVQTSSTVSEHLALR